MARTSDRIPRTSVVDEVTDRLRADILSGAIPPEHPIRVAELEKRFGVSHIPIREALRRLETQGLVVASPQRATIAAGVALDDLAGLYDLRRLIEVEVARRAVGAMTDADVDTIREALEEMEGAADSESAEFWEQHRRFHWAILEPGGTEWVKRVLDQLWQAAERYIRLFVTTFGSTDEPMREHRELLAACEQRDADRVAEVMRRHLTRTEQTVREGYLAMSQSRDGAS